jgi:hypothetical protein
MRSKQEQTTRIESVWSLNEPWIEGTEERVTGNKVKEDDRNENSKTVWTARVTRAKAKATPCRNEGGTML